MFHRLLMLLIAWGVGLTFGSACPRGIAQEHPPLVSAAMRTLFNPAASPPRKTMGLLQRNFLDVAGQTGELEVAIVVDGTESMGGELAGVRESTHRMIADLKRLRGGDENSVRVALVVYRDSGSPSGEVEIPLPTFTSRSDEINAAMEQLQPESGAPFYNELMDVGVHEAITRLPWSEDPTVSKWILLFGDAPPYELSYHDKTYPESKRRFADELLISLATRRGVQIHCVLCDSTEETKESHVQSRRQTRQVMDRLASETGGMVLDLSYPAIREALAGGSERAEIAYTPIQPITGDDLAAATRRAAQATGDASTPTGPARPVRIAILPHDQIDALDFSPDHPGMQVATALNRQFRALPGVRVKNVLDVEKQVRRLRAEGLDDAEAIRGLSARLGVDYIVWGRVRDRSAITSVAFRRRDNQPILQVAYNGSPDGLAEVMLTAAAKNPDEDDAFAIFAKRVLQSSDNTNSLALLSDQPATVTNLLTAMGCLEQAIGLSIGSEESDRMLAQAKAAAAIVIQTDPADPIGNWLMANVLYNQASAAFQRGDAKQGGEAMKTCRSVLRMADRGKDQIQSPVLRLEIEADYRLIGRQEYEKAIELYQTMTNPSQPDDIRARGHWMLSGLYAGDWGIDASLVDARLAREHVIAILSLWPDRPEAELLRKWLQWDEKSQITRHNHLPQLNAVLAGIE